MIAEKKCWCYNCRKDDIVGFLNNDEKFPITYAMSCMIVCPQCGNKRCPHATDHNLTCTNSNQPGQPGSRY